MTYEDFKKVVEFLDIKTIQVVVDFKTEFKKFRKLDLFNELNDNLFIGVLNNMRESESENWHKDYNNKIVFFLDLENDYNIERFLVLNDDQILFAKYQFEEDKIIKRLSNSIILNYDKFIDLIS